MIFTFIRNIIDFHKKLIRKIIYYRVIHYIKKQNVNIKNSETLVFNGRPHLNFPTSSEVHIGNNFICNSGPLYAIDNSVMSKIWVSNHATLFIGDNSGISNTVIVCSKEVIIGDYVNIGAGTLIIDSNFHSLDSDIRTNRFIDSENAVNGSIHIGNKVFIGAKSIILKDVTIGERSIVAAGSVVVGNIPEGEMWGGNPAKFIKKVH